VQRSREQLVARSRSEQQCAGVDDVVDRHDVDLVDQSVGESSELLGVEQFPALVDRQLGDRVVRIQ
jgi:hypothetical protein